MSDLSKEEKDYLIEIIKEEITEYIESGYEEDDEYVQTLIKILNKLKSNRK